MHPVTPLPTAGEVFLDVRGSGRVLRVSRHDDAGVVVLSLWSGGRCTATFRLPAEDVPQLLQALSYDAEGDTIGLASGI